MVDFATTDLSLAIAHHLLIFLLAGVLAFEIGLFRSSMKREGILRIASVDNWYGSERYLWAEVAVFDFMPAFAAAMPRGYAR
jgi:uncharacterized membrane protein